jgi:hypothetical protein
MQQLLHDPFILSCTYAALATHLMYDLTCTDDPDARLHPEVPLPALLGLTHLRIAAAQLFVERGAATVVFTRNQDFAVLPVGSEDRTRPTTP